MFAVKVVIQGVGETVLLRYKTEVRANLHRKEILALKRGDAVDGLPAEFADDYGTTVWIEQWTPQLVILMDLDKVTEADVQYQMDGQKVAQAVQARQSGLLKPVGGLNGQIRM